MTQHHKVVERLARAVLQYWFPRDDELDHQPDEVREEIEAALAVLRPGDDLGSGLRAVPEEILTILADTINALESKEMAAPFILAKIHGQEYQGPFIDIDKLKAMRRAAGAAQ